MKDRAAARTAGTIACFFRTGDSKSHLPTVIVEERAARYLDSMDWLEELSPVAFSFPNTMDGR